MSDLVFRHRPADLLGDPFMGADLDPVMPTSGDATKVEDATEGEDPPILYPETNDDQPVVTNPLARKPIRPEATCVRTTFHVNLDWRLGGSLATASNIVGQMYVERLTPPETIHPFPIVLIHGDYHTGQV
ncbi:hypothetical protein NW754_001831 [Fusarium falciforme]|uniref:Uncharacterized protein n=1 Tax=Fusarium falciforme TaxID=195108 RepID=A0A9W8RHK7_9HYPO|nr:hypothetical protein NW754_001831 [Fusarium falciforme]KAJ4195769.1 hypothetical protein NW755_001931 [Fusarium falciforme]